MDQMQERERGVSNGRPGQGADDRHWPIREAGVAAIGNGTVEKVDDVSELVMVHAPIGRDAVMICQVLGKAGVGARQVGHIRELTEVIRRQQCGAAFIAEEAFVGDGLGAFEEALRQQPAWSDLPLVIMTGGGKATQHSEALVRRLGMSGNLTLLERPLRILTLVSAVQSALRARRKQYEIRRLLIEAQEGVRQRDRFLAMLGHELRNPLAAIRTAVDVLDQGGLADPVLGPEQCRLIARQAKHVARLVDDLLDVARVTSGKIVLNRHDVDLRDIARRSIESVRSATGQRHRIEFDVCNRPAAANVDPVRMEQVVTNLLTNAVKYTPAGEMIRVYVESDGSEVRVGVQDHGDGIPVELLGSIFEPFMQVERDIARSRGGLGLGLPLVRSLAEMHGGSVTAHSHGVGTGSRFEVRLPAVQVTGETAPGHDGGKAANGRPARGVPRRRVLLVEDGPDVRSAMRSLMRLWGHDVILAENGLEGVEKALTHRPELALVDIGLPGIDGYEVARRVRAAVGDQTYLVALTGYGQPEDRQRALDAGFDMHVVKPVGPETLLALLSGGARVG